jgi:uncharacterized membrane protein
MRPVQLGVPLTTKEMMRKSPVFKFCFWGAVLLTIAVIVLGIVSGNVRCSEYRSCYWQYGNSYYNECYNYGSTYCCMSSYSYCGDSYCRYKYSYTTPCMGVFIALWICSGLAFFLAVTVLIMFCNFRRRARDPIFNAGANYVQVVNDQNLAYNPNYQQQPIYYAQPQVYQVPNQYPPQNYYPPQPAVQQPLAQN